MTLIVTVPSHSLWFLYEKLIIPWLIKKSPTSYGTRRFSTAFTEAPPPFSLLGQINPVHSPILSSWTHISPLSSHLRLGLPSFSRRFIHQNYLCSVPYMPHALPVSFFSITRIIFGEEYRSKMSWLQVCFLFHCPVTSSLWGPNTSFSAISLETHSVYISSSVWEVDFHSYLELKAQLYFFMFLSLYFR
jgi:hypothetical protein